MMDDLRVGDRVKTLRSFGPYDDSSYVIAEGQEGVVVEIISEYGARTLLDEETWSVASPVFRHTSVERVPNRATDFCLGDRVQIYPSLKPEHGAVDPRRWTMSRSRGEQYIEDGDGATVVGVHDRDRTPLVVLELDEDSHWVRRGDIFIEPDALRHHNASPERFTSKTEDTEPMTTPTEPLRDRVWAYLTNGEGDVELRRCAAFDLAKRGAFDDRHPAGDDAPVRKIIEDYLKENPRNLCREGRDRFSDALLQPPVRTTQVLLQIRHTGPLGANAIGELCRDLNGKTLPDAGTTFKNVTYWDYVTEKGDGPIGSNGTRKITDTYDAVRGPWRQPQ